MIEKLRLKWIYWMTFIMIIIQFVGMMYIHYLLNFKEGDGFFAPFARYYLLYVVYIYYLMFFSEHFSNFFWRKTKEFKDQFD